tara:strand:- start:2166 stop:3317 length:1152 start_codon:yes stop_codon:yes gene_type:complete
MNMANTNLGEGHEKTATGATYQNDGLRDSDVLSSPSLTNVVETGLGNGIIPLTLNRYDEADRNNPVSGNGCVRPNGTLGSTSELYVDTGIAQIDGMFYSIGSGTQLDIAVGTNYHPSYHASAIPNGTNPGDEAILLVYVDPRLPNNVGFVYGSYVDTATGLYPSSPSANLVRQNMILGSVRVGKGASGPVIHAIEDKRLFQRPGPVALSAMEHNTGDPSGPRNDFIAGLNAGALPQTKLGILYTRDPAQFGPFPQGVGQTHLFLNSDQGLGITAGGGGEYQITPVHRTIKTMPIPYPGPTILPIGIPAPGGILFAPLLSEEDGMTPLINIDVYDGANNHMATMKEGFHFTASPTAITLNDPGVIGLVGAQEVVITYVHASHTN